MALRDLRPELRPLYAPGREPSLVDVPELAYLAVDGSGAPAEDAAGPSSEFQQAIGALYPVAYTIRFTLQRELGIRSPVMPLEAVWFAGEGGILDPSIPPSAWRWRALLVVADEVTAEMAERAIAEAGRKRPGAMLDRLRFERWREGPAAQVLHVGPYAQERATVERLLAFVAGRGLAPRGGHHEIYLGDPRLAAPEKLRTVLRQAVEPAAVAARVR